MTDAQATSTPPAAEVKKRRLQGLGENPLVRAVARIPATVRTKLLVAFLCIAALLVVVVLLGVRALGQSNSRAVHLAGLQHRVAGYQALEASAMPVRQILSLCAGTPDWGTWLNGKPSAGEPTCLRTISRPLQAALVPLGNATELDFRPTAAEAKTFGRIKRDYRDLAGAVEKGTTARTSSFALQLRAQHLAIDLEVAARNLADGTTAQTNALIAQNTRSYSSSRDLFIGVAAGAVGLALLLGFVLAWSLIG